MNSIKELHEEAIQCAKNFRISESALLDVLLRVDNQKVFQRLGYSSLHTYCVSALGLTDAHSYALIGVARKSREIPELKTLIDKQKMSLSNGRRIVSIITPENKAHWLEKAASLSQRELEREIVKAHPEKEQKERIKPISESKSELRVTVSLELEKKLKRIQDLLSQKEQKAVSLQEALEVMVEEFLEKHDPIRRAERNLCPGIVTPKELPAGERIKLPAQLSHQMALRDRTQCTHLEPDGTRCKQKRWLNKHHVIHVADGGSNDLGNFQTLCFHHHRFVHEQAERRKVLNRL